MVKISNLHFVYILESESVHGKFRVFRLPSSGLILPQPPDTNQYHSQFLWQIVHHQSHLLYRISRCDIYGCESCHQEKEYIDAGTLCFRKLEFFMCKDYYSNSIIATIFMQALVLHCRLENIFCS